MAYPTVTPIDSFTRIWNPSLAIGCTIKGDDHSMGIPTGDAGYSFGSRRAL